MGKISNNKKYGYVLFRFVVYLQLSTLLFLIFGNFDTEAVEDRPVAIVLGKKITYSDLEMSPDAQEKMKNRIPAGQFEEWKNNSKKMKFNALVYDILMGWYSDNNKLGAYNKEIKAFNRSMDSTIDQTEKDLKSRLADLKKQANNPNLDKEQKYKLDEQIKTFESFLSMRKKQKETISKNPQSSGQTRDKIAAQSIKMWKANKSLYEQYGGRVIFQQSGYDPIGAREAFTREQEKNGNLKILDPEYAKSFWEELTIAGSVVDKSDAEEYFKKPWWTWSEAEKARFQGGQKTD
jgi:hypothetical protein